MKAKLALIAVGALLCAPAWGVNTPIAVSPGSPTGTLTAHPCPTFSWGRVDGARSYELVVYRVVEQGNEGEAVFRERVSGTASSWTPPLGLCLERGGQYAWSVRALNRKEASEWSPPNLLEVTNGLSQEEFEEALAVVRSYLDLRGGLDSFTGSLAGAEAEKKSQARRKAPKAPQAVAPTELSVDGGVEAVSFTGDGSTLTSLDPANLSPGTAAIDVTGTAANVTGTVAVAHGGTGATDAAGARGNLGAAAQAELSTHSGSPSAHHVQTVDTVLTEGQVEAFVTNGPLDGTNFTNVTAVAGDSASAFFNAGQVEEPRIDDALARDIEVMAALDLPRLEFLGITTPVAGNIGHLGMTRTCQAEFGAGTRMCKSRDIIDTVNLPQPTAYGSLKGWVQPDIVAGVGTSQDIASVDVSGHAFRGSLSCKGWSTLSTNTSNRGLQLSVAGDGSFEGQMTIQTCDQTDVGVACCGVASQ